jgi:hypothetical protein
MKDPTKEINIPMSLLRLKEIVGFETDSAVKIPRDPAFSTINYGFDVLNHEVEVSKTGCQCKRNVALGTANINDSSRTKRVPIIVLDSVIVRVCCL